MVLKSVEKTRALKHINKKKTYTIGRYALGRQRIATCKIYNELGFVNISLKRLAGSIDRILSCLQHIFVIGV